MTGTNGQETAAPRGKNFFSPSSSDSIPPHLAPAALRVALTAFPLGFLAGHVVSIALQVFRPQVIADSISKPWLVSAVAEVEELAPWWRPQLHLYLLAWSTFHLLEFVITARYNSTRLMADSFLISNGLSYHLAHLLGLFEFLVESFLFPTLKQTSRWTYIGLVLVFIGQLIRSLAMVHAADNFSHEVAHHKRPDHRLVTDGIYAYTRHPSYLGFFTWALGTQIGLSNPLSTIIFAVVLWRFFSRRIRGEEIYLVAFFGREYEEYRKRVGVYIPFVR
ncbi:ICMT-domain-containing protein [Acaromyces ingoldii]|uniref:Protein-S-isoprenylcysteine O-methyltransferase n=1 Tax=Acaromyces ingoldii TaxID=215250 RepID=A0A316YZ99_9BASI|nr:ICMT-domain-containing protein [Acaromyces ingoldii]PWN94094.1 ICMT-domain-containing protein [Acaromyces ingoldii]